jgi:hypothetical protein
MPFQGQLDIIEHAGAQAIRFEVLVEDVDALFV